MDLFAELTSLTTAFDAAGIEYALCGAIALAVHGVPRATRDIDVMARDEALDRLRDAARTCGFTIEALPMTFAATGITIRRFTKPAHGYSVVLDVVVATDALDAVWRSRSRVAFASPAGTHELSVVSRDGLITLKLAAGRPQDLVDIQNLKEAARGEDDA